MINDSAGIEVNLIDKSERASAAVGFRSAAAVEAERGLCNTPVLISSAAGYAKVFGVPTTAQGRAAMEAYLLAQRGVPQVVARAMKPDYGPSDKPFACISISPDDGALTYDATKGATAIGDAQDGVCTLYFKGEGQYPCKKADNTKTNVVLRFSKPEDESAYADPSRVVKMQVFDFTGASHIDENTDGKMVFTPVLSDIVKTDGTFDFTKFGAGLTGSIVSLSVTAFVNGKANTATGASTADVWTLLESALTGAGLAATAFELTTSGDTKYIKIKKDQNVNAADLSISVSIDASCTCASAPSGRYIFDAGYATVSGTSAGNTTIALSTSASLVDRADYMFVGTQFSNWANYYAAYCKETYVFSFSPDDFDADYVTLQADSVLGTSDYVVCKLNENFGTYGIDWSDPPSLITSLVYFDSLSSVTDNAISAGQKSMAHSVALSTILDANLTDWRCVCAPNLGDVMTSGDYVAAVESAQESSLGLSNLGVRASTDALGQSSLNARHGNRFIADFAQYGYRSVNGRRMPVTMACLVTELLNTNYNNGNEARPPMAYTYGQVACTALSQTLTGPQRQQLARQYKINPVRQDGGFYLWDERTSQLTDTSLSDIHNILSFIWMKFAIYDAMKSFIAEYNDAETVSRGLSILKGLRLDFISKKYVEEAQESADKNVIGDEVLRFSFAVRFKGCARFVSIDITAYSQTQSLAISLAQEVA